MIAYLRSLFTEQRSENIHYHPDCPCIGEIGKLQVKVMSLELQIEKMQIAAREEAMKSLEEKAESRWYRKGIEIAVRVVSATQIAGALMAVGKFTGAIEFILKILKL